MTASRQYDLIVYGATGFTGALTAEYLARKAPARTRWALAGRSLSKLEAVRDRLAALNPACASLDLVEADSGDAASLQRMAKLTRVLATTVGPYIQFGEPLVAACAAAGTDYLDLTGEPEFVDLMWLRHHQTARDTGARLVHCCGFDSIPHDLGVYFMVKQMPADVPIRIKGYVRFSGDFSGGTFHSAISAFGRVAEYASVARQRRQREGRPVDRTIGSVRAGVHHHKYLGTWIVPFPSIDPQVVKRSAAALDQYGPDFRYGHFLQLDSLQEVAAMVGGAAALVTAAQFKPARDWLLKKKVQGEGPGPERRAKSWFRVRFHGSAGDQRFVTEVSGGDPGYGETAKMLAESALCLAFDRLHKKRGQLTPAAAMGDALLKRLQRAGINFKVVTAR